MAVKKNSKKKTGISVEEAARLCATIADDMKAENILLLDVREVFGIADYFIICTSGSSPQSRAIAREADEKLGEKGFRNLGVEGLDDASWVLLDFGVIVMHVFLRDTREYYQIEMLWGDAPRVDWSEDS